MAVNNQNIHNPNPYTSPVSGMGTMDLLGLTPRGQVEYAKWKLFYNPGMWRNANLTSGVQWGGTMLFGPQKSLYNAIVTRPGQRLAGAVGGKAGRGINKGVGYASAFFTGGQNTWMAASSSGIMSFAKGTSAHGITTVEAQIQRAIAKEVEEVGARRMVMGWGRNQQEINRRVFSATEGILREGAAKGYFDSVGAGKLSSKTGATINKKAIAARTRGAATKMVAMRAMGTLSGVFNIALAFQVGAFLGQGAYSFGASKLEQSIGLRNMDFGGNGVVARSQAAYTERQRAIQEMNATNTNARRLIGAEAGMYHA